MWGCRQCEDVGGDLANSVLVCQPQWLLEEAALFLFALLLGVRYLFCSDAGVDGVSLPP